MRFHGRGAVLARRFWSNVNRCSPDECWPWLGSKLRNGYGQFWAGKMHKAHRYAFFLEHGFFPVNEGSHTCHNRACCNPAHVVDETRLENQRRSSLEGRLSQTHLTESEVRELYKKYVMGVANIKQLASAYCVSWHVVGAIVHGLTWKQLGLEPVPVGACARKRWLARWRNNADTCQTTNTRSC